MRILALGDVVSSFGCSFLRGELPKLKAKHKIDVCIANGENSADGNGITPDSADHLFFSGVDIITTGNHCFRRREIYNYLDDNRFILRPCNYPENAPGRGVMIFESGGFRLGVVNLIGTMFLENLENPFLKAEAALKKLEDCQAVVVDFHAESTSEKQAMGYFLDGRASAVFGTHTHVQTADERILPNGTGYISDLGMCGAKNSVLGVRPEIVIEKFIDHMPCRFETVNKGERMINGCIFEIEKSGRCISVERVFV